MALNLHTERLDQLLPLLARRNRSHLPYAQYGKVLALNPTAAEVQTAWAYGYETIGRAEGAWDGHGWQAISPSEYATALGSRLPMDHLWGVTLPNEPNDGDAQWMAQAVREIRSRWPHLTVIVGQWANGHDGFPIPVDRFDLSHIIYGFHSYGRPDKPEQVLYQSQDLALRHRRWIPPILAVQPNVRFWCTEFGCTMAAPDFENGGAVGADIGLLDTEGFDFAAYQASIGAFMLELALDRKVLGLTEDIEAFLYEFGAWPKWASMDGLGTPLEGWWADYAAEVKQEPAEGPLITRVEALAISRATLERAEAERLLAAGVNTGGETMGPEILERADFGEWWEAGGWRNFAVFLLATGRVDAPNAEKRDIYVDGLESGAKDAAAFLRSLPLG